MGKRYTNHYSDLSNEYTKRERNIKKAKGNPNKNVHQKKNGSNYGGVMAQMLADKAKKQEHVTLPAWLRILLAVLFVAVLVTLALRLTVLKDNLTMSYLSSLLLGVTCGVLFYVRLFFRKQKKGTFYSIISLLLVVACLFYTLAGIVGLTGILS